MFPGRDNLWLENTSSKIIFNSAPLILSHTLYLHRSWVSKIKYLIAFSIRSFDDCHVSVFSWPRDFAKDCCFHSCLSVQQTVAWRSRWEILSQVSQRTRTSACMQNTAFRLLSHRSFLVWRREGRKKIIGLTIMCYEHAPRIWKVYAWPFVTYLFSVQSSFLYFGPSLIKQLLRLRLLDVEMYISIISISNVDKLTIIRRRRSEYWWIFPETKSTNSKLDCSSQRCNGLSHAQTWRVSFLFSKNATETLITFYALENPWQAPSTIRRINQPTVWFYQVQ